MIIHKLVGAIDATLSLHNEGKINLKNLVPKHRSE